MKKGSQTGSVRHTVSLAQADPTLYFESSGEEAEKSSSDDWIRAGTAAASVLGGLFGNSSEKLTYAEFIRERDARLQELLRYGAEDSMDPVRGWPELHQGFTHDQIKKNLLKDYTGDYQRFMDVVFWPVLRRVNPNAYNQLKMRDQGQSFAPIPTGAANLQAATGQSILLPTIGLVILLVAILVMRNKGGV